MTDEPTHFITYKGDVRNMRNEVGPTWDGHMLHPVDAEYDPKTDTTRVGFITRRAAAGVDHLGVS